jgi:hypothetical protein
MSSSGSSHDATQNQVTIAYINFYDTELSSDKVVTVQNMQSVTYFFKTCGEKAVRSNQNAMQVSNQLRGTVKQSTSFVRRKTSLYVRLIAHLESYSYHKSTRCTIFSLYFVTMSLHVSGPFVAHHQEAKCIMWQRYLFYF